MLGKEHAYVKKVDQTLEKLRNLCLGQDTPLSAILPNHLLMHSPELQAKQISEQLLFSLIKLATKPISPEEISQSRTWLHGVTLYLLTECNTQDHTFAQLKRLIFLPQDLIEIIFKDFSEDADNTLGKTEPPSLFNELEGSIWFLLNVQDLTSSAKAKYNELINLLVTTLPKSAH